MELFNPSSNAESMEVGDFMANESFNQRMTRIIQRVYNRNKLLAYDMIVMVNYIEHTNYIIQDGIVYNTREV